MKKITNVVIGLMLVVVLLGAAVPARAAKYADVTSVVREGKTLVISGQVPCPSIVTYTAKVSGNKLMVYAYQKPNVMGGVCNVPRTEYTLRIPFVGNQRIYVNGKYWSAK